MRDQLEQYAKRCKVQLVSEREVAIRLMREQKIEFASSHTNPALPLLPSQFPSTFLYLAPSILRAIQFENCRPGIMLTVLETWGAGFDFI